MDEYQDLDNYYNDEATHDMWVDFDCYENTGEPDYFNQVDMDDSSQH